MKNLSFIAELLIWCFIFASVMTCVGTCVERHEKECEQITEQACSSSSSDS